MQKSDPCVINGAQLMCICLASVGCLLASKEIQISLVLSSLALVLSMTCLLCFMHRIELTNRCPPPGETIFDLSAFLASVLVVFSIVCISADALSKMSGLAWCMCEVLWGIVFILMFILVMAISD